MSSTNKTEYLKLNQWLGSDRPQRIDFVDDNRIIDDAIKLHNANSGIHITSEQKDKINEPYVMQSYGGTGSETYSINLGFSPKFVIVFTKNSAPMQIDSSGDIIVNQSFVAKSNGTAGGVTINGNNVIVTQSSTATDSIKYNLNKLNGQYCIIAFK